VPRRIRTNRTSHAGAFLRSLRIDQDYGSAAIAERYVLTSNALRATRRILDAIDNGTGGAWTLVGPFGTGKSAFCLYLAHLLAASSDDATQHALQQLHNADAKLAKRVSLSQRKRLGFEALLVSGSAEPISTAILRTLSISPALQRRKATASIQSKARKLLQDNLKGVRSPTNDIVALVARVVDSMKGRVASQGLLLVLDELGQFLEFAANHRDSADVFLLQQLAELAARSGGRLALISVLHQDFREYAAMLPSVERAEWEKIRGRFEDIAFEEPPSQLLRFVAAASAQCHEADGRRAPKSAQQAVAKLAPELWDLGAAPPRLAVDEGVKLIQSCTPLHPLTAVLLGPVFRRVGQNERSAFSFLASEEPTALRAWMSSDHRNAHELFDIVDLHEYLLSSLGNALLHTADAKRWAETFEAESRHHALSASAVTVLRAIALLGIASRWYGVRASRDILRHALSGRLDRESLDAAITELQSASVIVQRKYNDSFVVWEGSDVDVEARLDEGRGRLRETVGAAALLDKHYRMRPLLARRHSFETGTLRFFDVRFTDNTQLNSVAAEELASDGRIVVILTGRIGAARLTKADSKCFSKRTLVLAVSPNDNLTNLALEMAAAEWVERNTPELDHDPTARRELYARKADVERQLRFLVDNLLATSDSGSKWFYQGRIVRMADRRQLNERLSKICDQVFHDAPRIDNEIINRQELSSSAAAARRNLIERMIDRKAEKSLGLEGNPAERSIYRSLLSDEGLGLHRRHRGVWGFHLPPSSHRDDPNSGFKLFEEIKRFLAESDESPRAVSELFHLLRQPPLGLREGPIPVLICAALLAREGDVALYKKGEFQPSLSSALFEDLIKRPDDFSVRQLRISGIRSEVFDKLGSLLGQVDVARQNAKQQVLTIARLLIRFTRSLPEYSQKTDGLSPRTRSVREVLLTAKEPETMLLADIPQAVGVRPFKTSDRRRSKDVEAYVTRLRNAIVELRDCYPKLTTSVWQSVGDAFSVGTEACSIRTALRDRASALAEFAVERDMRMLLERILADSASDEAWLNGIASLLAERLPAKWRDEDLAHFGMRLRQFVRRFTLLEATVANRPKGAKLNGAESLRVALTSTRFGQFDHTIHLNPREDAQAQAIEEKLSDLLDESDPTAALAALCRLLHNRVAGSASPRELSCEGVHA
jgi:ABC-type cobalamin transport system ATPase subunit